MSISTSALNRNRTCIPSSGGLCFIR